MSYEYYRDLIDDLFDREQTTGTNHSEDYLHYTEMNVQRMNRLDKTTEINEELLDAIDNASVRPKILTITEGWCGDAAQIIPVLDMMAEEAGLRTRYVLRDKHKDLIDCHLTNGSRSIPKVLFLEPDNFEVLAEWGPRPKPAQEMFFERKESGDMGELKKDIQLWYARDKQQTMQQEWLEIFKSL